MNNRLLIVLLLCCLTASAQQTQENARKYEWYRNRLHAEFMLYTGDAHQQGSHLPMESRYTQGDGKQVVYWADGTWWLGHYVAVLATEYARLQIESRPEEASATLADLREAMRTYERLDAEAESCWGGESSVNGFYLRDDVPQSMASLYHADQVRSDYALRCGQPQSTSNSPSQDQAWASYLGFLLLDRLVDDTSLRHQAANIACRMVEIMQYKDEKGRKHWQIVNPVNQLLVQKEGDIQWLRYPHTMIYRMFGDSDAEAANFDGAGKGTAKRVWKVIQNNYSIDRNGKFNWYGVLLLSSLINEKGRGGKSTAEWLVREGKSLASKRPDYGQSLIFPHLPLVNQVLYDSLIPRGHAVYDLLPAEEYERFLTTAPPEGAHRIQYVSGVTDTTAAPWHTLSLFCPWHMESQGEFNMLDYLLLYNLYHLVYLRPEIADRPY